MEFNKKLLELAHLVDAVNITDNASAIPRISSIACAQRALDLGIEPVLQLAVRDRTRISFQSDLIGASAAGIRNILIITGDHPNKGVQPYSRSDIWDIDSIQAIWMARRLRDEGIYLDGRQVSPQPSYLIGAAAAPFASTPNYQAVRAEKKINAGAQFFQTNIVFNLSKFKAYLEALDSRNLLHRMHVIAGIAPIRSIKAANYLQSLPGVEIPEEVMDRIYRAKNVQQEAHQINLELIDELKSLPGVDGIHFMAFGNFSDLKCLIMESGLRASPFNTTSSVNRILRRTY